MNEDREFATCKGCLGTAPKIRGQRPVGWYGMTVQVPPGYSQDREYVWLGLWCSIACLKASIPDLAQAEALARQSYDVVHASAGPAEVRF